MLHSIIGASDFGSTALEWIEAASLEFTFASVGVLGLLVLIRTFLGWALLVEMEGRWPWQGHARAHRYEPPAGEPREVKLIHPGGMT